MPPKPGKVIAKHNSKLIKEADAQNLQDCQPAQNLQDLQPTLNLHDLQPPQNLQNNCNWS